MTTLHPMMPPEPCAPIAPPCLPRIPAPPSRRFVLAGLAALPAAATAPILGALLAEPDPIFAAIERRQATHSAWMALNLDDTDPLELAARDAALGAEAALLVTTPTTPAGIAALARYAVQMNDDGLGYDADWLDNLLARIAEAADAMGAAHA